MGLEQALGPLLAWAAAALPRSRHATVRFHSVGTGPHMRPAFGCCYLACTGVHPLTFVLARLRRGFGTWSKAACMPVNVRRVWSRCIQ